MKNEHNIPFPLQFPLEEAGIKELSLRRPTVGDLRRAQKLGEGDEMKQTYRLFSSISMVSPEQIEALEFSFDFTSLSEKVKGLMDNGDYKIDQTQAKNRFVDIDLKYEVEEDGKKLTRIRLHRLSIGDMKAAEKFEHDEFLYAVFLVEKAIKKSQEVVDQLELGTDFAHARDYVMLFLGANPSLQKKDKTTSK